MNLVYMVVIPEKICGKLELGLQWAESQYTVVIGLGHRNKEHIIRRLIEIY